MTSGAKPSTVQRMNAQATEPTDTPAVTVHSRDDSWEASVTIWLEAGAQLAAFASDIRWFLDPGTALGGPACSS
ncbi:DUF6228 family protein [Kitasatospora sp. NPDC004669]|uniref:DUF6228 family protein n=1 Tax=Kitasatospora sp. NPDC004669 TaxID=3154555 RepID=UPI0033B4904A